MIMLLEESVFAAKDAEAQAESGKGNFSAKRSGDETEVDRGLDLRGMSSEEMDAALITWGVDSGFSVEMKD